MYIKEGIGLVKLLLLILKLIKLKVFRRYIEVLRIWFWRRLFDKLMVWIGKKNLLFLCLSGNLLLKLL